MASNALASTSTRREKLPAAAERKGVSVKTLRRRIADGSLRAERLGNRIIVVDPDEVDALFQPLPSPEGR